MLGRLIETSIWPATDSFEVNIRTLIISVAQAIRYGVASKYKVIK